MAQGGRHGLESRVAGPQGYGRPSGRAGVGEGKNAGAVTAEIRSSPCSTLNQREPVTQRAVKSSRELAGDGARRDHWAERDVMAAVQA